MTQPTGPVPTIIAMFHQAAVAMVEDLVQRLKAAGFTGLTPAHNAVFENIDPGGTRLTELATRAGVTHQSMSELVTTLQRRGYVERIIDPCDRRARLVRLTPLGRRLARLALHEIAEIQTDWGQRLANAGVTGDLVTGIRTALTEQPRRTTARSPRTSASDPTPADSHRDMAWQCTRRNGPPL